MSEEIRNVVCAEFVVHVSIASICIYHSEEIYVVDMYECILWLPTNNMWYPQINYFIYHIIYRAGFQELERGGAQASWLGRVDSPDF